MKKHWALQAFVAAFVLVILATAPHAFAQSQAAPKVRGAGVHVGAFRLHVQLQQQRVALSPRQGAVGAALPVTALEAAFDSWDPATGTVGISVALANGGGVSLVGPIEARLDGLASPMVIALNPDGGNGAGSWHWKYGPEHLGGALLAPSYKSSRRTWMFRTSPADFQIDVNLFAAVPLAANEGATLIGAGGATVTVAANSIPYEALVDVALLPSSVLRASAGDLPVVGVAKVTVEPTRKDFMPKAPLEPLQVSIPAAANLPSASFIVAQDTMLADDLGESPGVQPRLVFTGTASRRDDAIVTNQSADSGIRSEGVFAFLANTGSGFATGVVSDSGGARAGAIVGNNKNTLVAVANASGRYNLYISGNGAFTVRAFDPLRGSGGAANGSIAVSGATVTVNVGLSAPALSTPVLDGIRNGGFERGDLSSWSLTGAAVARQQLGPTSTGVVVRPTEGQWMVGISTGAGAVGSIGSSIRQRFRVPAGVRTLRLDVNFVSEEFPEFVGTIFDDSFRAVVTTPNGDTTFARVSVNSSGGFQLIGDCFFPGGDQTCGMTGWREASVDLSPWAGTGANIQVDLVFTTNDAGDNVYDTNVLVDNIRFSTIWINANIVSGATADMARVLSEIRGANEILSQAGINVRLRSFQSVADPGGLADLDDTWTYTCTLFTVNCGGELTAEEGQLLAISRSATLSDVNVYYVRSHTSGSPCALAFGPDDFRDGAFGRLNLLTRGGTTLQNTGAGCLPGGHILAHELGHLLLSPQKANDALEHAAGGSNFMGGTGSAPLTGIVSRGQSTNINQAGAPLLAQ